MLPGGIGFTELIVIAIVAVVLFGSRLPDVARNFGRSYTQFRKGLSDLQSQFKMDEPSSRSTSYASSQTEKLRHYRDAADGDSYGSGEIPDDDVPRFVAPPQTEPTAGVDANSDTVNSEKASGESN